MPRRFIDGVAKPRAYDTQEYHRLRQELLVPGALCWLCGGALRFDVPARHPLAPSVDHVTPLARGGHPTARENARPAHYGCNAAKRDREPRRPPVRRSRNW